MTQKHCTSCKKLKPLSGFSRRKASKDGLSFKCRACSKEESENYRHTRKGLIAVIYHHQQEHSRARGHQPPDYTLAELREFMLANTDFERLFIEWKDADYGIRLTPSCDRKDDYIGYSFENILRVCTFKENNERSHSDIKKGINRKPLKAIHQLTMDGQFIREFYSAMEASRVLGISDKHIGSVCLGRYGRKSTGGFKWRYA